MSEQKVHIVEGSVPVMPYLAPMGGWRDELAKVAMQGLIANGSTTPKDIAQAAYIVADAMIKARSA